MKAKLQDHARWDDIRVFLTAHRLRSFGAAAARLGVDTSTCSRRVTALELRFGAKLFERTREGLLPTPAAERVLPAAEAMEAAHGMLLRDVTDVEEQAEGVVRVSVTPGMADAFIAPLLVRLRERHPRIRLEIDAAAQARDLTRREADIAVRTLKPQGADLVRTKLGAGPWLPATSPELAKSLKSLRSFNDCAWITWDREQASFAPARWVAQHAPKAEIVLRTSHFASQLVAAESGLGVGLFPTLYLRARRLALLRCSGVLASAVAAAPVDDLWLVGHRITRDVPRVAAVWSFLADSLRATTREDARARAARAR